MYEGHTIKHFYHIYADGQWQTPVFEHLVALNNSGLMEYIDEFNVGIVGRPQNREHAKKFLEERGVKFTVVAETNKGWEQETLDKLYEDALATDLKIKYVYCHTKGATNPSKTSNSWRQDMTVGVIYYWEQAAKALDEHDAAGIFWIRAHKMFGGNFWWATSNHIAKLGYPCRLDRWGAERWLRYIDGIDCIKNSPIKIMDFHPTYRLGYNRRQVFPEKKPKVFDPNTYNPNQTVVVQFTKKISGYKPRQIVTLPDCVFLRAIIKGGHAEALDPIGWTPEKADEEERKFKERNES